MDLSELNQNLSGIMDDLQTDASIIFLKVDLDDALVAKLGISKDHIESNFKYHFSYQKSYKSIQFLETMTLDLSPVIDTQIPDLSLPSLRDFYTQNQNFWSSTNQTVRRYTKKSLSQPWHTSAAKSEQNFAAFYEVYTQTKDRQNFAIQPRSYLYKLFQKEWCKCIILSSDQTGKAECVWLGIESDKTLTYLFGGNTDYSFSHQGQYLAHLVAVQQASQLGLDYYDLGGYNKALGFGKFKEGYKGQIRSFYGAYDFKLRPNLYNLITPFLQLRAKIL
jgi:lipid II:glycine glycyltransferase (peptidoglycan interpeptide bridge formation enzyme)